MGEGWADRFRQHLVQVFRDPFLLPHRTAEAFREGIRLVTFRVPAYRSLRVTVTATALAVTPHSFHRFRLSLPLLVFTVDRVLSVCHEDHRLLACCSHSL